LVSFLLLNVAPSDWDLPTLDFQHDVTTFSEAHDNGTTSDSRFDERGDYRHCHSISQRDINLACGFISTPNDALMGYLSLANMLQSHVYNQHVAPTEIDYNSLCPHFLWHPANVIKHTSQATTQLACIPTGHVLRKWFKSPNPTINMPCHEEDVATDTFYSDTPAVNNGSTMGQFFCGTTCLICDICGMKIEKQFPDTLEDNIRAQGATRCLLSDHAAVKTSASIKEILRSLYIVDWQS
jgi:hypothetical protein